MIKYDQSLLQSQSGFKMIELIIELDKKLKEYHDEWMSMVKDDPACTSADIAEDEAYINLREEVKMLKKDHHKSLNSLKGFRGKTYYDQRQYMKSERRRERYNRTI